MMWIDFGLLAPMKLQGPKRQNKCQDTNTSHVSIPRITLDVHISNASFLTTMKNAEPVALLKTEKKFKIQPYLLLFLHFQTELEQLH